MADEHDRPATDLDLRLQVIAELRGLFREAVSVCDLASLRLATAQSDAERERINTEVEGFCRRLGLAAIALGDPGGGGVGGVNNERKETP